MVYNSWLDKSNKCVILYVEFKTQQRKEINMKFLHIQGFFPGRGHMISDLFAVAPKNMSTERILEYAKEQRLIMGIPESYTVEVLKSRTVGMAVVVVVPTGVQ